MCDYLGKYSAMVSKQCDYTANRKSYIHESYNFTFTNWI